MATGTVIKFDRDRCFGFIRSETSENVFVHGSNLIGADNLIAGEQVEFDRAPGRDGKDQAINVKPLRGGPQFDDAIADDAGLATFLDR